MSCLSCFFLKFPTNISCCYRDIKIECFSTNVLQRKYLERCMSGRVWLGGWEGSLSYRKQYMGGEMHYGRIYIQYFALWSSHWPGGLIVCVFVCVTTILWNAPFTLSMHQLNGISVAMSKGVR